MTEDLRAMFIEMRNRAMQCTYLSFIDTALPTILSADACDVGYGYVLGQPYWIEEEGKFVRRPIQMGGRRFTKGALSYDNVVSFALGYVVSSLRLYRATYEASNLLLRSKMKRHSLGQ